MLLSRSSSLRHVDLKQNLLSTDSKGMSSLADPGAIHQELKPNRESQQDDDEGLKDFCWGAPESQTSPDRVTDWKRPNTHDPKEMRSVTSATTRTVLTRRVLGRVQSYSVTKTLTKLTDFDWFLTNMKN